MEQQARQQMSDRLKAALGVTDEEWKVLQPKIEKVQALAREARGGDMGMSRRGPAPGEGATERPQSALEKARADLQRVLANKDAKPEEIKAALTALREARAKALDALVEARVDLLALLTVRQEAQLVMMGILE